MLDDELEKLRVGAQDVADRITTTASDAVTEVRDLAVGSAVEIRDAATQTAQQARAALPSLADVLAQAVLLPGTSVSRPEFLVNMLRKYPAPVVRSAVALSPVQAGIPYNKLHRLAGKALGKEARRTTVVSMAAGLPGGVAAAATIPADLTQLYAHLIRAIQMLSYLYGWRDTCYVPADNMSPATRRVLILFLGAMAGNKQADAELERLAPLRATDGVLAAAEKSLVVDDVAQSLEGRMAHRLTGQVVGKSVPLAGAVISGTLSYGGFSDMWKHLRKELEKIG